MRICALGNAARYAFMAVLRFDYDWNRVLLGCLSGRFKMPDTTDHNLDRYLAISRAVAGQLDFKDVLLQIAGEVKNLLPHDHMDVAIIEPDNRDRHVAVEVGVSTGWGQADAAQPIDNSPIRGLLRGEVANIITGDAWKDPQFHFDGAFDSPIYDARLHSRIHVPLQVHGIIYGSLNISSHRCDVYSEADLLTAQNIADLIAPYFFALIRGQQAEKSALAEGAARGRAEALRQGALRLTEGMERERRRLGMELHDQTLADLTRIYRQLSRLARKPDLCGQELAQLEDDLAQCTRELRRIIEDAKPGILELFGFHQAVEAQLERSVAGNPLPIKTKVVDTTDGVLDRGPEPVRIAIFRIVQEAVNNAIKHGCCSRIDVTISKVKELIEIRVSDNGSGPQKGWDQSTGGVDNMKVRAALISAELLFEDGTADRNTRIIIRLPLAELLPSDVTAVEKDDEAAVRLATNAPVLRSVQ